MSKIKLKEDSWIISTIENKSPSKISFWGFSKENVKRDDQVSSILLPLKDIEPFEHNVRIDYDQEPMERLKQSIQDNGNIWNIDVFHIIKGDRYIISDWHRTHRAYTELYWPEYKVEVVVRKEFPEYSTEVEIDLMKVGFITSNTKENLWIHEELEAIFKYLEKLDNLYPEKSPHTISQKKIYQSLWLSESKAMKLNKIIQTTPRELFVTFKELDVSYKSLVELSWIKNKEDYDEAVNIITSWWVDNSEDIKKLKQITQEVKNDVLDDNWDFEEQSTVEKIKEKFEWYKEEKSKKNDMTVEERMVKDITFSVNKVHKALLNLNIEKLNDEQYKILKDSLWEIQDVIKKKNLK